MQSHELLRDVFQKYSAKQVASDMGLSTSMIYKWAEPSDLETGSGAANPLDRLAALQKCTGDTRLTQWLCQQAGGFFVKNPDKLHASQDTLLPATNAIVQEFADLLGVIVLAVADNTITNKEAEDIRTKWEELKTVTEGFVLCCEQGTFNKLPIERPAPSQSSSKTSLSK